MSATLLALPPEAFALSCARQLARRADATAQELRDALQVLVMTSGSDADRELAALVLLRLRAISLAANSTPMPAIPAASPDARSASHPPSGVLSALGRRTPPAPVPTAPAPLSRAGAFSNLRALPWLLLAAAAGLVASEATDALRSLTLCATGC